MVNNGPNGTGIGVVFNASAIVILVFRWWIISNLMFNGMNLAMVNHLCKMDGYPLSSAHPSIEQWALLMYEGIFIPLHKSFRSTKALLLYIYYVYVYIQVYRPVYSLVSIDTRLMYVYYVYIHMYMLKHIHIYMFKS